MLRFLLIVAGLLTCVFSCDRSARAQTGALVPVRRPAVKMHMTQSSSAWAFKTRSPVTVHSTIVRLGDIIEPVDANFAPWDRIRRTTIGLLPSDGTVMQIERERLGQTITTLEASPRHIEWFGPEVISVNYQPTPTTSASLPSASSPDVAPAADNATVKQTTFASAVPTPAVRLDKATSDRLRYWLDLAIRRDLSDATTTFDIKLGNVDQALPQLVTANGIERVELLEPAKPGVVRALVVGRSRTGPVETELPLVMAAHPLAITTTRSIQRGERIATSDIKLAPITADRWKDSFLTSPDSIIGMESRSILRAGHTLSMNDVGPPILVHRGDLIELRVMGGGVMITTNAKSLGEGAESDLIEVETIEPKRRMVAKVVHPGLVEIVTRAPQVRP